MNPNDFKILIAEDEPAVRRVYEKTFKQEGYEVVMVEAGQQILAELQDQKFDLLITDMKLENMSALEALPFIRKIQPELPIVVVSGHYVNLVEEFHQKGLEVDFFFNKPLSLSVLQGTVRKILAESREITSRDEVVA